MLHATTLTLISVLLVCLIVLMYKQREPFKQQDYEVINSANSGLVPSVVSKAIAGVPQGVFYNEMTAEEINQRINRSMVQPASTSSSSHMKEVAVEDINLNMTSIIDQVSLRINAMLESNHQVAGHQLLKAYKLHQPSQPPYLLKLHIVTHSEGKQYALAFEVDAQVSEHSKLQSLQRAKFTGYVNEYDAVATPGYFFDSAPQKYDQSATLFAQEAKFTKDKKYEDKVLQQQAFAIKQDRGIDSKSFV